MESTCANCGTDIDDLEPVVEDGQRFCSAECADEYEEDPHSEDSEDDEEDDEEDDDDEEDEE